jgi:hypothetical protein
MSRHVDGFDIDNSNYQSLNSVEDTIVRIYLGGEDRPYGGNMRD